MEPKKVAAPVMFLSVLGDLELLARLEGARAWPLSCPLSSALGRGARARSWNLGQLWVEMVRMLGLSLCRFL